MEIKVVIGANFGDEGKGLMTDYFASQYKRCLVVRSNGGSQAGHTVVTPDGERHIFKHFGSGSLVGADTFLTSDFIANPINFRVEHEELIKNHGINPKVFLDGNAMMTTPFDMLLNQAKEAHRGDEKHGSCGHGIFETIRRNKTDYSTLLNAVRGQDKGCLKSTLQTIRDGYFMSEMSREGISNMKWIMDIAMNENLIDRFIDDIEYMIEHTTAELPNFQEYDGTVFEGAQGLLLDRDNATYFPHLTPSYTGLRNPALWIKRLGLKSENTIEVVYVTRTYMTRHGAGKFESECRPEDISERTIIDKTNIPNEFQGTLRFGYYDEELIEGTILRDFKVYATENMRMSMAITHLNETDGMIAVGKDERASASSLNISKSLYDIYLSAGMTRNEVYEGWRINDPRR